MEIQVARTIAAPAVGRDLVLVREHASLVVEDHQRAGVLGPLRRAFVATRNQHYVAPVWRHAHLVSVDTRVHRRLGHVWSGAEIIVNTIHAQRTGVVKCHQYVLRFVVECQVDRPRRQAHRITNLTERTRDGVDPERRHVVFGAGLRTTGHVVT